MALIQTAGYSIGKISSIFSPKTPTQGGDDAKKAVLKKTKVKKDIFTRNKILQKKRNEKKKRIEKESFLESVKTKGKSGLGKLLSVSDPGGIFGTTLDFIGTLLLGWIVNSLPQIKKWVEDLIKRIQLLFASLKSFIKNIVNWFTGLKNLLTGTLDNIRNFDFSDKSGKMKKAMTDMENAFKGMQNDVKNLQNAFGGDMGDDAGILGPPSEAPSSPQGASQKYASVYELARKYGDPFPEVTAAQSIQESGYKWGDQLTGRYNIFGQTGRHPKYGGVTLGTPGDPGGGSKTFMNFGSYEEAVQYRVKMWSPEYGNAKTPYEALMNIQKHGGQGRYAQGPPTREFPGGDWMEYVRATSRVMKEQGSDPQRQRTSEPGAGDGRQARGANQTPAYQRAVAVGRALEGQGYRAWQHPDFNVHSGYTGSGRERVGRRSYNSYHNYGEALDYPLSHNSEAQLNKLAAYFRQNKSALGIAEILWKTTDHYDHLHVSFKGGGSVDRSLAGVPSLARPRKRQQIIIIEEDPPPPEAVPIGSGGVIIIGNNSLNRFMKNQLLLELAYT